MKKIQNLFLAVLILSSVPWFARAAEFTNPYIKFDLPPSWQCKQEGGEWVCEMTSGANRKDAVIVLAAKIKGDGDNLEKYTEALKIPRGYTSPAGKWTNSVPKYVKITNLNGRPWVDALHQDSELPDYFTRYLATVNEDIGVAITFSIKKAKYQQYLEAFDCILKSLTIFRKSQIEAASNKPSVGGGAPVAMSPGDSAFAPNMNPAGGMDPAKMSSSNTSEGKSSTKILIGIALLIIGFIYWKKRSAD